MKKFAFQFQYLLDVYSAREQAAQHALHTANKQLAEVENARKAVVDARKRQVEVLEKMSGVVPRLELAASMRNMEAIHQKLAGLTEEIHRCTEEVDRLKAELRQEMTNRRVLENLCDRERNEWMEIFQSEEQKQMDELAIGRWNRLERAK